MNTLLIGARASGKTTLGRMLAERLGHRFIDLDECVLAMLAANSVREAWAEHGEAAWRNAEAEMLTRILREDRQIVALGGGTPMIPAARHAMEAARASGEARAVYLQCSPTELARRLTACPGDRPSLTGADPSAEVAAVLAQREPTYLALADLIQRTDGSASQQVVSDLAAKLAALTE